MSMNVRLREMQASFSPTALGRLHPRSEHQPGVRAVRAPVVRAAGRTAHSHQHADRELP